MRMTFASHMNFQIDRTVWARLVKSSNKASSLPINIQHTSNLAWSFKHLYAVNLPQYFKISELLLMLMLRNVLTIVWCRFGNWSLVIKLKFCLDFEHNVWSRFWSWSSGKTLKGRFPQIWTEQKKWWKI